nr:lutropin-choriogonadotropic hormone receptor-like isoform X2 [Paramormyrops kingsleyae]
MGLQAVCRLVALGCLLQISVCWTSPCPGICRCTEESIRCTKETQLSSRSQSAFPTSLFIHLPFKEVKSGSFRGLLNVSRIEILQSASLRRIKGKAFLSLHSLSEMLIQNVYNLEAIERGAFTDLPKLKYLSICNTGLRYFPDLTTIASIESYFFLELADNMEIDTIPSNAFLGMTDEYTHMNLFRNGFKDIQNHAFNGTKLDKLVLKGNSHLRNIHTAALEGAVGPSMLDVSSTPLRMLPAHGLLEVRVLAARSTPALKTLPPLESLANLQEAQLTYPSHCCAFHTWKRHHRYHRGVCGVLAAAHMTSRSSMPLNHFFCRDNAFLREFGKLAIPFSSDSLQGVIYPSDSIPVFMGGDSNLDTDPDDVEFQYSDLVLGIGTTMKCTPEPDAFNPCEDLLGSAFLRTATWAITVLAIAGNLTVLGVLLASHRKLTVSRFLMCNLAFADLCMGIYLLLIATADHQSQREYYNHATQWQTGPGCGVAGFLTVFASELSVYTLTTITLERWHTINYAMQLERRLRLRHVVATMAGGWAFSLLAALLPLLGVSSYTKVSICLPMDIETTAAQGYVVTLLLLNVAAFLVVCTCYSRIYLMVRQPQRAACHADAKIAKRMAVLVFTDFLCMAPISFFAISAALRAPLITVSHAKVLLVLFYPLNSLCNPFLYTIFTRAFRRDVRLLAARWGRCHTWTDGSRTQSHCPHRGPKAAAPQKPGSAPFYVDHIKMHGWFLKRGPK